MPDRHNMAKTMMIDIHPDALKPSGAHRVPQPAHTKKILLRRPGEHPAMPLRAPKVLTGEMIAFFEGIYDAALLTDLHGVIIEANVRAVQFFGYTREEIKGESIGQLVIGLDEKILRMISENLRNNQFTLLQSSCERNNGTLFQAEVSTSQMRLSNQLCLCFFIRDVSARHEAESALQQAHDELERQVQERTLANEELQKEIAERKRIEQELVQAINRLQLHDEAKSEFISNVSHEFRTPLTSIKYVAENMQRGIAGPMGDKAGVYLDMILADCERLAHTVEDILDLSRMDADTLVLNVRCVSFERLARRTAGLLQVHAEKEGLTLRFYPPDAAVFCACDVQKMERVIINIIKNAIKFTPCGGSIDVAVVSSPDNPDCAVLAVSDTGPGIPPEHIGRVTERYYRVGEYVSGTGLGLAICKELVERHGGLLCLTSPVPERASGTQVMVVLPRVEAPRVLMVKPAPETAAAIEAELQSLGYSLCTCGADLSGSPLVAPDVVILDWTAPDMECALTLANIMAEPVLSGRPLLVLTEKDVGQAKREILGGFNIPMVEFPWRNYAVLNMVETMVKANLPDTLTAKL